MALCVGPGWAQLLTDENELSLPPTPTPGSGQAFVCQAPELEATDGKGEQHGRMNVAGSGDTQRLLVGQALALRRSGPSPGPWRGSCQEREMTGQGGWKEEAVNSGLEGGSSQAGAITQPWPESRGA